MAKSLSRARAGEVCKTDPAVRYNRSVNDYPLEQKPYRLNLIRYPPEGDII